MQCAAVIGPHVPLPLLQGIAELPKAMLYRRGPTLPPEPCLSVGRPSGGGATPGAAALALSREGEAQGTEAWTLWLLGEIAAPHNAPEVGQAEGYYRQALVLAEALGMRPLQAHCHLGLGTLYAKTGQREQAYTELSAAIALSRAMEMTFWLPQVAAALARVEGRK